MPLDILQRPYRHFLETTMFCFQRGGFFIFCEIYGANHELKSTEFADVFSTSDSHINVDILENIRYNLLNCKFI